MRGIIVFLFGVVVPELSRLVTWMRWAANILPFAPDFFVFAIFSFAGDRAIFPEKDRRSGVAGHKDECLSDATPIFGSHRRGDNAAQELGFKVVAGVGFEPTAFRL